MMMTTFWHPDGTPMSAQQFTEMLFGRLPDFFKDEAELRAIWSAPDIGNYQTLPSTRRCEKPTHC
jgi:type I restriction enzyme, R subunit